MYSYFVYKFSIASMILPSMWAADEPEEAEAGAQTERVFTFTVRAWKVIWAGSMDHVEWCFAATNRQYYARNQRIRKFSLRI